MVASEANESITLPDKRLLLQAIRISLLPSYPCNPFLFARSLFSTANSGDGSLAGIGSRGALDSHWTMPGL